MTCRCVYSLAAALALFAADASSAGPLASASLGVLVGALPPASFSAPWATGSATGALSSTLEAGTAFNGTFTTNVPTSVQPPITGIQIQLTGNGPGVFTGTTPPHVGGVALFSGIVHVKGFGGLNLLDVPLQIGSPGTVSGSAFGVNVTAVSASWTAGTAAITGLTATASTATLAGSNGLNASGVGTLVLVTPIKIITNLAGILPAFGILTLTYVPEPGTLLLLGVGVAFLAALGSRRG